MIECTRPNRESEIQSRQIKGVVPHLSLEVSMLECSSSIAIMASSPSNLG